MTLFFFTGVDVLGLVYTSFIFSPLSPFSRSDFMSWDWDDRMESSEKASERKKKIVKCISIRQ